jgi:hypothetical protein
LDIALSVFRAVKRFRFPVMTKKHTENIPTIMKLRRKSHILFFKHLSESGWRRMGVANDNQVTARAVAYSMVGHVRHHMQVLKERYLPTPAVS